MGICRFGSLIKYIPMTITVGFTAGIAVTIIVGQIKDFLGLSFAEGTNAIETVEKLEAVAKSIDTFNPYALLVGAVGLAVLILWPMLAKLKLGIFSKICSKIPPSIIAVIIGIFMVKFLPINVNTIGTLYPELSSEFPIPKIPNLSVDTISAVIPSAFTIALLAAIESLLSCVVSDGMIGDRHNPNTELIAQGMGNICSGLFGGIPATGAIARTAANVKNGGRSPISGIVHAVVLLLFLLVLMPLAKMIPMPIIAAILFMVAYNMSEWRHFVHICKTAPKSDILVLVLTFVLTVVFDLVVAIAVGLVVAAVLFVKRQSDECKVAAEGQNGTYVYKITGSLFFANCEKLAVLMPSEDTQQITVDLSGVTSIDATAIKSFTELYDACKKSGIKLEFLNIGKQPLRVLKKSGFDELLCNNELENV